MEVEVRQRFEKIEAILERIAERQAAAEVRMDRADARMDRAEARMDRSDARMDRSDARFEKRMKGFEKLVLIGMKEIAELRRRDKELDQKMSALLRRGGNGRSGHRPH
jgi:hypothetical protein